MLAYERGRKGHKTPSPMAHLQTEKNTSHKMDLAE